MHGWILTMFFAELIRKDRSLIKTEIQKLQNKNHQDIQKHDNHGNSNYVKRILERYGCIYDSSDGDSCYLYKWLVFSVHK